MVEVILPVPPASLKRWYSPEPGPGRRMVEVVRFSDAEMAYALLLRIYTQMAVSPTGWATVSHNSVLAGQITDLLGRDRIVKGGA